MHGCAAAFGLAECALTPEEAQQFADVLARIQMLGGKTETIDPKSAAWANLILVAVTLYLPRFVAWRMRMKMERPARPGPPVLVMVGDAVQTPAN